MLRYRLTRGRRVWSQAETMWLILSGFVMFSGATPAKPAKITYGDLAMKMGFNTPLAGHTLARPLGLIGQLCLQTKLPGLQTTLPPLNVIVVSKETGAPGAEVVLRPGSTVEEDQAAVMAVDWYEWDAPSAGMFRTVWEGRRSTEAA
jgi:hypothetical protein